MKKITRKSFLEGTLATGGALALGGVVSCSEDPDARTGTKDTGGSSNDDGGGGNQDSGGGGKQDSGGSGKEDGGGVTQDSGGGTEDSSTVQPDQMAQTCTPSAKVTSGHPGHALTVPEADVAAGVEKTYSIQGNSGHDHQVTVTAANFSSLQQQMTVTVTSTNDNGHDHDVEISCA